MLPDDKIPCLKKMGAKKTAMGESKILSFKRSSTFQKNIEHNQQNAAKSRGSFKFQGKVEEKYYERD